MSPMVDHLARARDLRLKAAACQLWAKKSQSHKFGECYLLLAKNYGVLAKLEEEFVARQVAPQIENNFIP